MPAAINIRNPICFPNLVGLPWDHEFSVDHHYVRDEPGASTEPKRHWCFVGEIVDVTFLTRMCLVIRDQTDRQVPVALYSPGAGFELMSSTIMPLLQPGNTVMIMYAHRHYFHEGSEGICVESLSDVKLSH
jgi:hypothetical protein